MGLARYPHGALGNTCSPLGGRYSARLQGLQSHHKTSPEYLQAYFWLLYNGSQLLVLPLLSQKLKMPSMTIASLSSVSRAAYFGILAIATKPWLLYLAAGLNSLAGLQGILIRWTIKEFCRIFPPLRGPFWHSKSASKPSHRSGLAAVLPPSELGSVFSLIETIAATFPLILAPLASATYTAELEKEMVLFNVCTGEQQTRQVFSNFQLSLFGF